MYSRSVVKRGGKLLFSKPSIAAPTMIRSSIRSAGPLHNMIAVRPFAAKSWVPQSEEALQKVTTQALIHEVAEHQKEQATRVVPWFLKNMPAAYFKQISAGVQSQHVQAITTVKELMGSDLTLKMSTKEKDSLHVTYISSGTKSGSLYTQIKNMEAPKDHVLSNVNVFTSLDDFLALNVFTFSSKTSHETAATMDDMKNIVEFANDIKAGKYEGEPMVPAYCDLFTPEALEDYARRITARYALTSSPRRFLIQRKMFDEIACTDSSTVHIEPYRRPGFEKYSWVTIAAANVLPEVLLRLCSAIVTARKLDISRAHLDSVKDFENSTPELEGNVTMLRLLVSPTEGASCLNTDKEFADKVRLELKRSKWLDPETSDLGLIRFPELGINKAEVITALCSMLHGPLAKENSQAFSSIKSMIEILESNKAVYFSKAEAIAELFLERFDPKNTSYDEENFQKRSKELQEKISNLQNDAASLLLSRMLTAVHATLRTNFFKEDRYALSMRIDPAIMMTGAAPGTPKKAVPFGVFFCHGRHFNAFHCRFKDIARGGLRIVSPNNSDQFALESSRQFDEVYGLSYGQQLKNKDIPEGGAKGVILVNTPVLEPQTRFFAKRKAVKAFSDAMLDLIVQDSVKDLKDYYKKDELIYFGPDEQIIPSDIEWIINRAAQRGYPIPDAFMSSKQDNGFNHKEFGVTSEGVNVYLDVALRRSLNIDPKKDPFTIKITGGPDGDVAGNLIRILFRDYGSNCRVVGVADGFGVAEDPNGLDPEELLRLVKESLPITSFDSSKLSSEGVMLTVETEEGIARRNSMHFRVKADAFVPAGGRPNTIHAGNWMDFLDADGQPSSKLIVEGANIFITPEARQNLFDVAKVAIVKDSTANKCGVITSSAEVAASMLLSKQEFMAIKPELVEDVLAHLRELARLEGELLFREYRNYPGALPHFSERISFAIAKVTDAIIEALQDVQPEDQLFQDLFPLIKEGLPRKLVEVAGDRISSRFPVQYQRNAISSILASKLVYKEGIHLIETQPARFVADRAFQYYFADQKIQKVVARLKELECKDNGAGNAEEIAELKKVALDLLSRGGARTSLEVF